MSFNYRVAIMVSNGDKFPVCLISLCGDILRPDLSSDLSSDLFSCDYLGIPEGSSF